MDDAMVLELAKKLTARGWWLATAESCTGGLIGHTLTSVAGSSEWYLGGVVAYANSVKQGVLGVDAGDLEQYGAVSRQVVEAMAVGAARVIGTETAIAVSGVAGPGGGTPEKPVGTVWVGWKAGPVVRAECFHFSGGRSEVKEQSVQAALEGLSLMLD